LTQINRRDPAKAIERNPNVSGLGKRADASANDDTDQQYYDASLLKCHSLRFPLKQMRAKRPKTT
jgi:hypothetical protein